REGVFTLRTLDDAMAIREYAARCGEAVVIGGGLLGLETARGLKTLGLSVTALEFFPRLCPRQLDEEGATVFQRMVERLGIRVGLSADAKAIVGDGRVESVVLQDGRDFPAQMVVIAAGVKSNTELAADAGLKVEKGVVVDDHMATSAPHIYSAGDAASFQGRSWGIIPVARAQALVAAANMSGDDAIYEEVVPSTTLKIVDIELTSIGRAIPEEEGNVEIRRSDPEAGIYKKVVLEDDTLVGAIVIGERALARELERLISQKISMGHKEVVELLETY
ncbi:MAG: FAD-dependent oxidoreductase, partial [Anaerolineae bacterium]